ncbi:hypothetical protein [Desulfitobacterium sp. PCE1]|uniref:hypothetical protein n=1 Tax=Desulfitobacterium sp. PCE1 TaxID=146907 RepID=UPI0003651CC7|nr:hypothetical protein [Desulfitobacterium sp. PCE1]
MKEWVIKDNHGHYVHKESFCTVREGVFGYTSYHVIANGVYMRCITKQKALDIVAKLNEDKMKYGFPELKFHIEGKMRNELIKEMVSFKGERRIDAERACAV